MYYWLFIKFYNFYKKKNNYDPLFNSVALIFFAQIVHFFLIFLILGSIFNFEIPSFSKDRFVNKLAFLPISLLWLITINNYYKNKLKKSEAKSDYKVLKLYELLLLIFFIIIVPLYVTIRLSGGQIWK
ncbi:MAG TPA: hypothetical protein PLL09_07970 [Flavobacterium sp.]|uniref:hypothetical protein n=1 Tax=unclassified Flavobacterium TaxID=196869 RepID=UPI0025C22A51|nr:MULTISPECIES: hypothetical protein [unclassified Flavobacterium]HRE77745.1 hypothetical protein [Flavobacterium sp.]